MQTAEFHNAYIVFHPSPSKDIYYCLYKVTDTGLLFNRDGYTTQENVNYVLENSWRKQ